MSKRISAGQVILLIVLCILAVVCLFPLALVIAASFSSESSLIKNGFRLIPESWSLNGWKYVMNLGSQLLISYRNTIVITVVGTFSSLLIMSMLAFALSHRSFVLRKALSMMLLGTMLFSGGKLATYMINTTVYHLKDSMLILCMPVVSAMYVIILRTYIQENITDSLLESAKIDGAGDFRIYAQIVMPLLPPALASVGFMLAISYWDNWETSYMYISSSDKMPLQLLLMRTELLIQSMNNSEVGGQALELMQGTLPEKSARMAMLITVLGPIMIAYPFFQKYFVQGLTVGSVKG
jgi:multiple sugar transport system permease protein/putative aldouronate transport system permease protein